MAEMLYMLTVLTLFLLANVCAQGYVAPNVLYGPAPPNWGARQPLPGPGPVPLKTPYSLGAPVRPYHPPYMLRPLATRPWPKPQLKQPMFDSWMKRRTKSIRTDPRDANEIPLETLALEYHNQHRRLHGSPELTLDHEISLKAAQFAAAIAQNGLKHSSLRERPNQGENIILGCKVSGNGVSAFEAVKEWYSSVCHCDFNDPADSIKARPFEQLVWKATQKLGIGKADFKRGIFNCTVVVARYTPQGNVGNQATFRANVMKGLFVPEACQYVTNKDDRPEVMEPPKGNKCKHVPGFRGQFLQEDSVCTLGDIFQIFGVSYRMGKQAFKVVL